MNSIRLSACLPVLAACLLAGSALADTPAPNAKINKKIDNVAFKDAAGKTVSLYDVHDKKALVVVFLSFECPVSTSYSEPLADLAKTYAERGVAFLAVSALEEEDAATVARHAQEFKLPFPAYRDEHHAAVDAFKAETTPEAFVLDHNFVLRYRGRIDNGYAARLKRNPTTTRHDLREALDELLAGKPVSEPVTNAVGCPVRKSGTDAVAKGSVTYHRDVLPILQANCQTCHRPGEVGPFSLMTYKQAVNWAGDIKEYTQAHKMPPWKPVEGAMFHNERKLTEKEIATLAAWVDGGTPEGNPKDAPAPRQFTEGWQLGQPDLVLTVDDDFQLGASGPDAFRVFVLPANLTEDKYVTAVELRPGNPRIVHHSLLFLDTTGAGRKLLKNEEERAKDENERDRGPGYSVAMGVGFLPQGGLGGWAPGQQARRLPEGTGYFLPKGSDVIMQLHYHRDGRAEKDRTMLGLYFAKEPIKARFQGMVIAGQSDKGLALLGPNFFTIPAGDDNFRLHGAIKVQQDCLLHSVMPHMHMLGRKIKVTLTPPDSPAQTLVAVEDWDYNWQETYFLKEPITLKEGTVLEVEAFYDNSAKNPNNPHNPPKRVTFGEQTTNEMCFVFLGATSDKPGRIRAQRVEHKTP
jgi:peroxiredoxin/mono/diheme cytochrome c family protein